MNKPIESKEQQIKRMIKNNPSKTEEMCISVVENSWEQKRKSIESEIPSRFENASILELGDIFADIQSKVKKIVNIKKKTDKVGVIFSGEAGTGKTHAAYAILKSLIKLNPESVSFMTDYQTLFVELKKEFYKDEENLLCSTWDRVSNMSGYYGGVLFIDDLSSKKMTDFENDKLMMFLERRFNEYFPFILTTNIRPCEFKEVFGERLASRLLGYCHVVDFDNEDKRA